MVDDSAVHRRALLKSLEPHYAARAFDGGAAVIEQLGAGGHPDVLILDWYMPDVSGLEVCRFVRQTLTLAQLPILVLTGTAASGDLLEAFDGGANDFIEKPVSALELHCRVAGLARMAGFHSSLIEAESKLRGEASLRERFMSVLAHDLRQPLSTVLFACAALSERELPEDAVSVVGLQRRAAERMFRMVADLLDLTRNSPDQRLPIQRRSTDLSVLAARSVGEIGLAHADHVLALNVDGTCQGEWDPDRVAQLLSNLIDNAIKHGEPECPIDVRIRGTAGEVELRVSNRGPAISREIIARLALPFWYSSGSKGTGDGAGLGLHIVNAIVRAHEGTISVQHLDGVTHFSVHLPRAASEPVSGIGDAPRQQFEGRSRGVLSD